MFNNSAFLEFKQQHWLLKLKQRFRLLGMFNISVLIMDITVVYSCFLLLLLCICLHCQECMEEERDALLQIKTSMNSSEGIAFSNWYGPDCCQWEGVECNESTKRVSSIFFHYVRDQGLYEEWYPNATLFAQFKDLKELELPGNNIAGFTSPDDLRKLKHLQIVDLQDNLIENASHLCWGKGALPSLYYLDLSQNKLNLIPECLCDSLPLKELILCDNNLQGNISTCLNKMTSLELLDLSNNVLTDSFPSFHNLRRIEVLKLSRTQFKGKVSFSVFTNLLRISYLDISYNAHLELETESQTWFPSFNIKVLYLAYCNLRKIPSFLSTQNNLKSLDLSDNFLVGNIPSWLMHNTSSLLWVRGNNLSGPFPKTFGNISSQLASLDISNNSFHGQLPEDINLIFPKLLHLNASVNGFHGKIPPSFGRLKLHFLDLSCNKLQGEIPHLMTGNMSSLESLLLHDNNLKGDTLPTNSSFPNLRVLHLGNNDFTGTCLNSLSWSLSRSPALPQLRILVLKKNRLEGQIPQQICQMRSLSVLDLSGNNISGGIPDCFDNINSWTAYDWDDIMFVEKVYRHTPGFLDLSGNRLTGSIPVQITQLKAILILNMSNNLLTGQIPASMGNLDNLEALDLSNNKLFGELCEELTALTFLSFFNVSFNNLSGAIPQAKQFCTFSDDSYLGNPGLCGVPLARKCGVVTAKPSHVMSSQIANMATTHNLLFPYTVFILLINFIYFCFIE